MKERLPLLSKVAVAAFIAVYAAVISLVLWSADVGTFNLDRARHQTVEIFAGGPDPEHGAFLSGSGVYLGDGIVLTARHVVAAQDDNPTASFNKVWVTTYDGQTVRAQVEWVSVDTDVAVLSVAPLTEPAVKLSCDTTYVGERITVVGNPFMALLWAVTDGTIAGDRPMPAEYQNELAALGWQSMIPFSATIEPGNSGGPAFDAKGHVVGIVVAKLDNLSGLIPSAQICRYLPELAK